MRRDQIQAAQAFLMSRRALGGQPSSAALAQSSWWIDSVNGSDGNPGSQASPLQTFGAYANLTGGRRRVFGPGQSVDVTIVGNLPLSDPIVYSAILTDATAHFGLHGTLTPLLSGNLTAYAAASFAGNTAATMTATGLSSSHVGKLVNFPNRNAWATVLNVSAGVATIVDATNISATSLLSTLVVCSNNEPFVIYDGSHCALALDIVAACSHPGTALPPPVIVENLAPGPVAALRTTGGSFYHGPLVQRCMFQEVAIDGGGVPIFRQCAFLCQGGEYNVTFSSSIPAGIVLQNCGFIANGSTTLVFTHCLLGASSGDENVFYSSAGRASLSLIGDNSIQGNLGIFIVGTGSGEINFFDETFGYQHVFGTAPDLIHITSGASLDYWPTFVLNFASTAPGAPQFLFADTDGQAMPSLRSAAGGSLPALAACQTWNALQAAPFNGAAFEYAHGCRFAPLGT